MQIFCFKKEIDYTKKTIYGTRSIMHMPEDDRALYPPREKVEHFYHAGGRRVTSQLHRDTP